MTDLLAKVKADYNWVTVVVDPRHYPDPEDPNHPGFPDYRFYVHMDPDRKEEMLFAERYQEYQVPVITTFDAPHNRFKMLVEEDRTTGEARIVGNHPQEHAAKANPPTPEPAFEDKMKAVQAQLKGAGKVDNITNVHLDTLGKNAIVLALKDSGEAHPDPNEPNYAAGEYFSVWEKPNGTIDWRPMKVAAVEEFLKLVKA